MERPRVVVSVSASVDGRLTLRRDCLLLHEDAARAWQALQPPGVAAVERARSAQIEQLYGAPGAVLEGSGSLVPASAGPVDGLPPTPPGPGPGPGDPPWSGPGDPPGLAPGIPPAFGPEDFLPAEIVGRPGRRSWFTVVDSRGRVRWTMKRHGGQDLLVLVSRATPRDYLAFLRREKICHLVAGDERVDLGLALRRLRSVLGVETVVVNGGGTLQGALLRAGLIDELQLIVLPALIGGSGVPALFDGPQLGPDDHPTPLRLLSTHAETDGTLWLRYAVGGD